MDIAAVSSQPRVQTEKSAGKTLTSDFETFLKMLTTQMENQDPLEPIKSEDFAVQLATFSGVEQQVQTNDLLTALSGQVSAMALAQMAGWVGMEARARMPAFFDGTPIEIAPHAAGVGDRHELVVRDSTGTLIERAEISGAGRMLEWAGTDTGGSPLPEGLYSFTVESFAQGALTGSTQVEVRGKVEETRLTDNGLQLVFEGGATAMAGDVSAVREAAQEG